VPYHSQQPTQPYAHYAPPTNYSQTNENQYNNETQYNNTGYGIPRAQIPPAQMATFAPSTSQVPGPNAIVNPAAGSQDPKAGKPSSRVVFASTDEASNVRGATRRKNVYLPNSKSAKTLWEKREANKELIQASVANADAEIKEALDKKYTVATFAALPQADRDIWAKIAKLVIKLEESFASVSYE
jgi:hypothetical protein